MRSARCRNRNVQRIRSSLQQQQVTREAQVVVAGKVDQLPPVNDRRYATAGFNESIDRSPLAAQMRTIQLFERGP